MPNMTVFSHIHSCKPVIRYEFGYRTIHGQKIKGQFVKNYKCKLCKNVFSEDLSGEKMLGHEELVAEYKRLVGSKKK